MNTSKTNTRDDILAKIRAGHTNRPQTPFKREAIIPTRARQPRARLVATFIEIATSAAATVEKVKSLDRVPETVAAYLTRRNFPLDVALPLDPEITGLPWTAYPGLKAGERAPRPEGDAVVTGCYGGVAEAGSLVYITDPKQPSRHNLLGDIHIVILPASKLVGAYEEIWARLHADGHDKSTSGPLPRGVTFVLGPSRSADIEQTLELGAHGPRQLHILLVEQT